MGLERIVLPLALSVALVGGTISALAQAQNTREVQERRSSDDSSRSEISREDATRIAQEYSVSIEEVYRVDRELHQSVEETLRGLPIPMIANFEDFKRAHPFDYECINSQNFQEFLGIYGQFVQQMTPQYWRTVRQEDVSADERRPIFAFLSGGSRKFEQSEISFGCASLMRYIIQEFSQDITFFQIKASGVEGLYDSQETILRNALPHVKVIPSIFIYDPSESGELLLVEKMDGGFSGLELTFKNRQIFKEYVQNHLLR